MLVEEDMVDPRTELDTAHDGLFGVTETIAARIECAAEITPMIFEDCALSREIEIASDEQRPVRAPGPLACEAGFPTAQLGALSHRRDAAHSISHEAGQSL